ncbi:hypothetical protein OF83DRAFT_1169792 [Amylostereum chailletii]|nr:hypothetical protein OF83DRAFT_1169792 [Amylostereum chailletii]
MSSLITALVLFSSSLSSLALNDWNTPCFQGRCSWDVPSDRNSSGNLQIWGSSQAISDITPAAGWTVLECDTESQTQDIRLLCNGNETETGCGHLLDSGMEGKIVRLPEECGAMPFARVAKSWVSENQTIPDSHVARLATSPSQVRAMSLDTDFGALDPSKYGSISFAVQLSNSPSVSSDFVSSAQRRRRHRHSYDTQALQRRNFFDDATEAFTFSKKFNKSKSVDLAPIDFDKSVSVYSGSLPSVVGNALPVTIDANVDAHMHMEIKLGAVMVGTILPPKLEQAAILADLNGNLDSTLRVNASGKATFSSPALTVFEIPLDGFSIAGVVQIGPSFTVTAQVTAALDVGIDGEFGLSYDMNNVSLVFPPGQGDSSAVATASSSNTPSFSPVGSVSSVSADTNITAHLTPAFVVGLSVFKEGANVTLALDSTATLELSGTLEPSNDNEATGCVDVRTGVDIFAAASASLFHLFDVSKKLDIFNKSFDVFNKCFDSGDGTSSNSTISSSAISTPAFSSTVSSSTIEQTVAATAAANGTSSLVTSTRTSTASSADITSSSVTSTASDAVQSTATPSSSASIDTFSTASAAATTTTSSDALPTVTPFSTSISDISAARRRHFGRDVHARRLGGTDGFVRVGRQSFERLTPAS